MNQFQSVTDYLSNRAIPYKTSYDKKEAVIDCLFCDDDKGHLYIENLQGCFLCHKCGTKGSWKNLIEQLDDTSSPTLADNPSGTDYTAKLDTSMLIEDGLAQKYHLNLPDRIRQYLRSEQRGLTSESIDKFEIGWDGKSLTIPVYDQDGKIINIRHRRDPESSDGAKMWNEKGGKASIFNIKALQEAKKQNDPKILITEGEFDSMIACQNGFSAVTGTAGAATFKNEWVELFDGINTIYICQDADEAGKKGADHIASLFGNRARIVNLPSSNGQKVDITDYFVRIKHTAADFQKLLDEAKPVESTNDHKEASFELLAARSQMAIHPTLDFYDSQLYLTFNVPVRIDKEETTKLLVINSSRQRAIVSENRVKFDDVELPLRKVTSVPGDQLRWKIDNLQKFLNGQETLSPSLPFIEIRQVLLKFVDFRRETDGDVLTLWLLGTYCFPIFDAFPYLYFVGVKRSGKTKTLQLIERLAFNGILSSNISPAVLFRLVEAKRCTLALDEGEYLGKEGKERRQELQELLNSGYKRGAPAYRVRKNSKGEFEIETFEVFAPKAIANISGMDNVLEDRAITIVMVRTNNPAKGNLAVTEGADNWSYLRSLLYNFALDHAKEIAETYHSDPEVNALINRQNELWRPLLSIAKVIDKELPGTFTRIRDEAIRRSEETAGADLEDFDSAVLFALRDLMGSEEESKLTNKDIHKKANDYLEEDQQQYLTSRGVGSCLKRFGIKGKRIQGNWQYSVNRETLTYLLGRYSLQTE